MKSRSVFYPLVRAFNPGAVSRKVGPTAAAALLGMGGHRRRRRQSGSGRLPWLAAGLVAGGAAAAALLMGPARRREVGSRLLEPFQKTGGGVGKWVGQLLGKQVGAHPVATTKVIQGARNAFGSNQPES